MRAQNNAPARSLIPNIIIFGETGSGKSSLVNLIANCDIAKTSSGAAGCTLDARDYLVRIRDQEIRLWDTVGLNEPSLGSGGYLDAVEKAYKLISSLQRTGGITLLVFCMRGGRITAPAQNNYRLFFHILCDKKVPIALVLTNLENETPMEGWWEKNEGQFYQAGMRPIAHACITASPGLGDAYRKKYEESKEAVHRLLLAQVPALPMNEEVGAWFARLSRRLRNWIFRQPSAPSAPSFNDLTKRLKKKCGFSKMEAQYLARKIIETDDASDDGLDTYELRSE
ncbi:hypothetical protein BV22DRAFT_604542 [Leucogyrophana mollusca]|uniref:Uncharacterized protein n=1 Tax=Leucogyrophana mollusca TaxID=85980 RepID=A0ACB8BCU1_9AGAM|nr:hypothetical protein BV22DRAFT_604542 [Leucogyrophana mollusca]